MSDYVTQKQLLTQKQNYETPMMFWHVPYMYKFSRDVIFTVFMVNLSSMKISSSKFLCYALIGEKLEYT